MKFRKFKTTPRRFVKNLISHLLMDHRIPPVWCHLMSLDFRLSLKFDHLINIITIAREKGKNMKRKTY